MEDQPKLEKMLRLLITLSGIKSYSVAELAERFEKSERSIMRYLATFRNAGFIIECNDGGYRIPKIEKPFKAINELLHFSEEEAYILSRAIHSIDDTNQLKINLINKLYALYNFDRVVETVVNAENTHTVHSLLTAIREKKQVLLRKYRSSHGKIVRDRLVEPFDFTTNYTFIWAFEPESQRCKLFKTSRIGEVEALEKKAENEDKHIKEPIDVFRISSNDQQRVILKLSLRAYNLLIEEYPLAEKFITVTGGNKWQFEALVCGFEGVSRFCLGLLDEIEIIEPESLKEFMLQKIKKFENKEH
jgi:proteasome accessory factor C